jgi:hypothetical protein
LRNGAKKRQYVSAGARLVQPAARVAAQYRRGVYGTLSASWARFDEKICGSEDLYERKTPDAIESTAAAGDNTFRLRPQCVRAISR